MKTNLQKMLDIIAAFERKCSEEDYTDSGEAWEVLAQLRDLAYEALEKGR